MALIKNNEKNWPRKPKKVYKESISKEFRYDKSKEVLQKYLKREES